jgi:hypothetical protein
MLEIKSVTMGGRKRLCGKCVPILKLAHFMKEAEK